jgi:cytochrome oxidase Cu insertion factor (SCO1/SenC/PrrC family)
LPKSWIKATFGDSYGFEPMKKVLRVLVMVILAGSLPARASPGIYAVPGPWADDSARNFELQKLAGSYTVATMAYGACRRVCSTTLRRIEELHALAQRRHVALNFVVFGLDSSADKPADWADFRASHRLSFANITFLSGDPAATRRIATLLGIHYWRYGEHTLHDFRIALLSPEGQVMRTVDHFDDEVAELLP